LFVLFYKVGGDSAVNDARLLIYSPVGGVGHFDSESSAHIGVRILLARHYLIKELWDFYSNDPDTTMLSHFECFKVMTGLKYGERNVENDFFV
jgi:hypothetical protein